MLKRKFVRVTKPNGGVYIRSMPKQHNPDIGEKQITCHACRGKGIIIIPPYKYPLKHDACGGTGLLLIPKIAHVTICQGCNGSGLITIPPSIWPQIHKACGGTGLIIY